MIQEVEERRELLQKKVEESERRSDGTVKRNGFKGFFEWVWEAQMSIERNR